MENKTMNEMHGHGFSRGKERTLPRHEAHAASIRAERTDRASEHGRYFIRNNGTARAVYSSFAMNRKNKNGEWEPIRNGLTRTEHDYEASLGAFRTHFTPNTTARFCAEHNGASLNWEYVNAHAKPTLEVTEEIIPASGLGCGSRALYRDVDENVDIEYILLGDNLKENIIVKAPGGEYRYPFLLRTEGFEICPSKDNTSLFLYSAGNDTDTPDFIIPAPYLLDAAGVRSNGAYYEFSPREDGSTDFTVVADAAWMNDPARVYPVTVDPQLITTNTMMFSIYTLRTTSPYYTSNGCDCSCEELTNVYRVGRNSNYEYSTHIGITKQMFHTYFGRILSAKFVMLVRSNENGNITIAEGYPASFTSDTYEIDVTSSFLNDAENGISITLFPTEERLAMMDVQFESSGANAPYLAIEYLLDENDAPIRKEFPLAGGGLGMLDINSGEFVPVFTDVPASRSLLGVEIAHVYKKNEDSLFVGDNFRLNLHEKLEKQKSTSPLDASYVYTDPMGDKHALTPHYYYRDANGVRSEVSANHVEIKADGTLAYGSYGVTKEEHLSNGWKAMTQPEGVKNPELLDQRSEEQAKLEEQLESLEHTLKNLVRVDADSGEIKGRFANLTQKDYSNFIVKNANGKDDASKLYLPIDVAQSYQGLKAQIDALTIQDEAYQDQLINLETQKEALTIQLQTLEYQIGNKEEQSEASDSLKGSFETQKQALLAQEEALKFQQNSIFMQLHALDCQINDKNAEKKDAATCYEKIENSENIEDTEEFINEQQYLNGLIRQEYQFNVILNGSSYYYKSYYTAKLKSAIHEYNQLIEQYGILEKQIEAIRGQIQDLENQYECLCDQYDNLSKQLENLAQSGNSASSINEKNTIQQQKENCAEQKQIYEAQLEEIVNQASAYRKQFDKAIIAYVKTQAQLEEVYRHTPVNYVTNGTVVKGFNRNGELTVIYDAYENYVVLERDARHRITRLTDNNGNTVILRYYSRNRLSSITDAKGGKTTYHYTGERLTKIVSPDGTELKLTYENGNIASAEAESSVSYLVYAGERLTEIRQCNKFASVAHGAATGEETEVSSICMEYSVDWSDGLGLDSTSFTDETGKTEMYRFRSIGKPYDYRMLESGKVVQAERYAEYYVNEKGVETTPPSGVKCNRRKVTQAHENCLHVSASVFAFAEGDYEITALDSDNMPIWKETNQQTVSSACTKKYRTDYAYDDEKHLIRESLATDTKIGNTETRVTEVVIYTYDENGRCTRKEAYVEGEELKTGINIEEHVFNDKGVEIKSFTYNSLDPSSKFYTENEVDENGKVLCALDESGEHKTVFDYEHDGVTVKTERLPNGSKFSYGRDKDGTVTAITHSTENGEENSTSQTRTLGMVAEVKSGNNTVQYTYDNKRRVKSVSLNGVDDYVTYTYSGEHTNAETVTATLAKGTDCEIVSKSIKNAHGNVTKSTCGDRTVTNTYNDDQQLETTVDSVSGTTTIAYDEKGNVTSVTAPDHTESFVYDEKNVLTSKMVDGTTYTFAHKATADQSLESITVDGNTVSPATDALGRNTGKVIEVDDNKIAEEKISYVKFGDHATNLPSTVRFSSNGVFNESIQYRYDNMGNIVEVFENGRSACRYEYDALGRLIREDNVAFGKTTMWSYDNNGNIIARYEYAITAKPTSELHLLNGTCKLYTYADNSDQLMSYNGEAFEYDVIGNPTIYRGKAATWDHGRQLTSFDGNNFAYDARGRRMAKNGITFTYDSNGNLIKQSNGLGFFYDHTGVFAVKHNNATYFYRKDAQGNVVSLLDSNGATVVKYKYDAWGNCKVLNANGTEITDKDHIGVLNPFRYRSYYFDTETNLYFLKTRYYDPEIDRFMTIDDISYLDPESVNGLNLYAYCFNNPTNLVDYTGHAPEWLKWLGIGLAIVGTILVVAAVTVLTCGVGTLAGTMAGAVIYGAAQGIVIGAAVGVVAGGVIGGAVSGWSAEGILIGMGIGLGGGAIIGGVIGGFAGASSFTANSAYITQHGGTANDVKKTLSAFKGNPKLKNISSGTKVNRYWGGKAHEIGRWVSPKTYSNPINSLALDPAWGNTASNVSTLMFNQNATVLVGKVAAQGALSGGGIQWFVGNLSWLALL